MGLRLASDKTAMNLQCFEFDLALVCNVLMFALDWFEIGPTLARDWPAIGFRLALNWPAIGMRENKTSRPYRFHYLSNNDD